MLEVLTRMRKGNAVSMPLGTGEWLFEQSRKKTSQIEQYREWNASRLAHIKLYLFDH